MAPQPDTMGTDSASASASAKDNPSFTPDDDDRDAAKRNGTNGIHNGAFVSAGGAGKHTGTGTGSGTGSVTGSGTGSGTGSVVSAMCGYDCTAYAAIPEEVRCGYGSCKPDCLQVFNNPRMFLFLLCWFAFIQGFTINGINNVNTASIERRFKLQSSKVGLISSAYDISAGIFILPVTYFGTYAHQPRLITIAALVMAFGSLVMALPHFTTGPYAFKSGASDVCNVNANETEMMCAASSGDGLSNYLYVFMLGQFLHGFGGTVLYSLGIVFIDANVRTTDSPMYQGLLYCAASLGPAVGYLFGGYLLSMFVDVNTVDLTTITITPYDVQWVGAWWVGFVISSSLMFCTVFFFIMPYAKELPSAKRVAQHRISQAHQNGSAEQVVGRQRFGKSIRDLPMSLRTLLRNPVLMAATGAAVTEGMVTSGFATFLAKFIQNQYGKTASTSAILAGLVAVPGAAGGNAVGGLVTKCFNLKVRGMLRLNICLCFIAIAFCGVFFAKCPGIAIAGVSVPYNSTEFYKLDEVKLDSACNAECGCSTASYEPVCGVDRIQYFSPCHAGCNASRLENGIFEFSNCSCLLSGSKGDGATQRVCEDGTCFLLYIFLPSFFFLIFFTFMAAVPTVSVTLRCIPDIQRSFAIGIQWLFVRFLGTVPGPILFGFVFDKACLLWQEKCGVKGSCWIYNTRQLSLNLAVLGMIIKAVSAFFYFLAYRFYKPPPEEEVTEQGGTNTDNIGVAVLSDPGTACHGPDGRHLQNGSSRQDEAAGMGFQNEAFTADMPKPTGTLSYSEYTGPPGTLAYPDYTGPAPQDFSTAL